MNRFIFIFGLIILIFVASLSLAGIPKMINYQGMLTGSDGKTPVSNANYPLLFSIYNTSSGGSSLWSHTYNVAVTNGLFNVILGDSSAPINLPFDTTYWLGIKVGADLELSPRIRLTSVGYAYRADTAGYALTGPWGGNNTWTFLISDGADTTLRTGGRWGIARYGNTLYGNADSTHVNLGVACTTGMSGSNEKYCTVGGGFLNTASGNSATVGGGRWNTASYYQTTVGGGLHNTASGNVATVGGGGSNAASGSHATVGGGAENTASGYIATVGGGYDDTASGEYATIPGGLRNLASGDYSFAAGRRAKANHDGAFVWADSTDADFASTGENQFLIRASGGVGIGTTSPNKALTVNGSISIQESNTPKYHIGYASGGLDFVETGVADYRLFIQDAGAVGIGTNGPTEKLDVNGTARLRNMPVGSYTAVYVSASGVLYKQSSSKRYKEKIRTLEISPEETLKLQPVRFEWKTTGEEDIGLIAEEVEKAIPDLVVYDNEGKPDAVKYDKISLYLLGLVKELKAENEELKKRIEALERR